MTSKKVRYSTFLVFYNTYSNGSCGSGSIRMKIRGSKITIPRRDAMREYLEEKLTKEFKTDVRVVITNIQKIY